MIKNLLLILFLITSFCSSAQTDPLIDSLLAKHTHEKKILFKQSVKNDSAIKKNIPAQNLQSNISVAASLNSLSANDDSAKTAANDSLKTDSAVKVSSAAEIVKPKMPAWKQDTIFTSIFNINFNQKKTVFYLIEEERRSQSKDFIFYALCGILFFLGFIKIAFPKYFYNIFRLFFQSSFRQKQNREVLLQDNLPSLLTNILFFLSGGMFIALIALINQWMNISFPLFFIYSTTVLSVTYVLKFAFIRLSGWIFHAKDASDNYISIVFLVNKLAGIILIPLSVLLAFSDNSYDEIIVTISVSVFILLLLYRYLMMFSFLRSRYSIHPFHFFIYLCCVEIIPMLVIYKILFNRITGVF